jgi:hypothetical protein
MVVGFEPEGMLDSFELTRREPAMARGPFSNPGLDVDEAITELAEMGLSESLSRLLFAAGLGCGNGKSPADASSQITSLKGHRMRKWSSVVVIVPYHKRPFIYHLEAMM